MVMLRGGFGGPQLVPRVTCGGVSASGSSVGSAVWLAFVRSSALARRSLPYWTWSGDSSFEVLLCRAARDSFLAVLGRDSCGLAACAVDARGSRFKTGLCRQVKK